MAGAKETPRQKMINMMYLVLTAMLALQVSNAILQKFLLLNNSLVQANEAANNSNNSTLETMKVAIAKAGVNGKPENIAYLKQAEDVRKTTAEMIEYIEGLKNQIVNDAGGGLDPETGGVKNMSEEDKVAVMMVGTGKNGKGYELKNKLNAFVANLQKYAPKGQTLPSLALDASQDPILSKTDATTRNKDFAELNFAQTPVPAALASLSQKQSELRRLEGDVLDHLASLVGVKEAIKFDKVFAVVIPDARSVVAGQKYKAEIAIGAYSTTITPRISVNGSGIPIKEGKGIYELTAQGGEFDKNGMLKRQFKASVSYAKPDGTMQTVDKVEEYTVLKPSVQLESGTLPPLYFRCANRLQTTSPGLGSLYSPTFRGSGAEFIPGGGGKVTVVPNAAQVSLDVVNDGIVLQSFPFRVRRVPKPAIKIFVNGAIADERRGASATGARVIEARAIADESFKATNPEDAAFRVTEFEVNLARGNRRVGNVTGGGSVNIGSLAQQASAGDRYVIVVKKVERKNFKGEIESVDVGEVIVNLPLN